VCDHLRGLARGCGVRVAAIVGGLAHVKQQRMMRQRPQVVVATPGRLWELMRDGDRQLTELGQLSFLVLDEADRMVQQVGPGLAWRGCWPGAAALAWGCCAGGDAAAACTPNVP
jgi:superfamily II DNA/RNA helicase